MSPISLIQIAQTLAVSMGDWPMNGASLPIGMSRKLFGIGSLDLMSSRYAPTVIVGCSETQDDAGGHSRDAHAYDRALFQLTKCPRAL